jgi:DNA helicase-2/ATP-dependent DNA helicase PcrA
MAFVKMMEGFRSLSLSPSALIESVFTDTGYKDMLTAEGFEGEGKIQNVEEFISAAVEYEKRCSDAGEEATLVGFLEEISLVSDVDKYDETADAVVLMTIHAAKGLEFPTVFLAGAEDGIFPSQQNMGDAEEMSEERRLMYVAITRAKDKLYITHAKNRTMYGRTGFNPLSVFIREELPDTLTVRDGVRKAPPRQSVSYGYVNQSRQNYNRAPISPELRRPSDIFNSKNTKGAGGYGIEKLMPGTRVIHAMFGEGTILSARDMGGDVLYEVAFDSGQSKKLMATFAKLKKVEG